MKAYLNAVSYYLPETIVTNEQLANEFPEWTVEKIANKVGIKERHIADQNTFSSDLAVAAGKKLFKDHNIDPNEIDFILLCTQSPDYFLPTTACIVQDLLGIPTTAGALDFNLGCSGYVYGLSLAKGLIGTEQARNVLLITSETYSKFIHNSDKGNRTIFGDGAAATLISTDGFAEIKHFSFGTDGKGANKLIVKKGGLRYPINEQDLRSKEKGEHHLAMNGPAIFNFTADRIPDLVQNTLERNKKSIEEIDIFIFHQANAFMLEHVRKKLQIPQEKFMLYMEKVGNTVSSTIPIAFKDGIDDKVIIKNQTILLAGFGVGYSWSGVILQS